MHRKARVSYHRPVTFADLEALERVALMGLVRLMVHMDGEFSPEEVQALSGLARDLGGSGFWAAMSEVQTLEQHELQQIVKGVIRPAVQEWMYGVLVGIAAADGIEDGESELLGWLMDTWSLGD